MSLLLAVLLLLWPSQALAVWTAPIGVPSPSFGITETAPATPSPWTSPTAGFYYVDGDTGSDSGNSLGTPAAPRKTIPLSLPAGALVELHGTYAQSHSSPNGILFNGTVSQPIFVRGVNSSTKPKITRTWELRGSYFILENLEFHAGGTPAGNSQLLFLAPAGHAAIRASDVHGDLNYGGIAVVSFTTDTTSDIVIWDNLIHDNGDVNSAEDQDCHGIAIGQRVNNVWIVDNEITRNSGDGIQINAGNGNQALTHHIYVGRNVSHHNKQTGMWSKEASDVIFSQNTSYGHRAGNSSPGDGMGGQYSPTRFWIIFNTIYDNEYGIRLASTQGAGGSDLYIVGNLIYGNVTGPGYGISLWDFTAANVVNNTIVSNKCNGVELPLNSAVGLLAYNNIIALRTDTSASCREVYIENGTNATNSQLQFCVTYQASGERIAWAASNATLAAFQSATGKGQNCVNSDPLFVNAAGANYRLTASSPALNAGTVSSVYATFESLYGLSIAYDITGTPRPAGASWDIGAYEGQGVPTKVRPGWNMRPGNTVH